MKYQRRVESPHAKSIMVSVETINPTEKVFVELVGAPLLDLKKVKCNVEIKMGEVSQEFLERLIDWMGNTKPEETPITLLSEPFETELKSLPESSVIEGTLEEEKPLVERSHEPCLCMLGGYTDECPVHQQD
jgi:hypothetical protein